MRKLGLYIHIPFCKQKCKYCDFLSFDSCDETLISDYAAALIKEIKSYKNLYERIYTVDSVFIGGGTPSLLKEQEVIGIIDTVYETFSVAENCEITLESNPGTLTFEKLRSFFNTGINRLSIGAQSFNDDILKSLGRIHSREEFLKNYRAARKAGFDNINIDLMFAVPGHTMEIWEETVKQTVALEPEHISFYSLQLEEGTPFFNMYKKGEIDLVSDKTDRQMYHFAADHFEKAGYEHYEISNCAKKGYRCRHNLKYWDLSEYLGIGLGAHSYIRDKEDKSGSRYQNTESLSEYFAFIRNEDQPIDMKSYHVDSEKDAMAIFAFTALRTRKGIDLEIFEEKFRRNFFEAYRNKAKLILKYKDEGLLNYDGKRIWLTEKGIDVSNDIMSEFV